VDRAGSDRATESRSRPPSEITTRYDCSEIHHCRRRGHRPAASVLFFSSPACLFSLSGRPCLPQPEGMPEEHDSRMIFPVPCERPSRGREILIFRRELFSRKRCFHERKWIIVSKSEYFIRRFRVPQFCSRLFHTLWGVL
jgi:hypothetical protein